MWKPRLIGPALLFIGIPFANAASYYPLRLDDPKAVYLTPENFAVHGDGIADDTSAVQAAIDRLEETRNQGIVFVPEGRYRLTRTIYVWTGIRLIGYGTQRPVFVLGEKTPGFQEREGKYLIHFVSNRPAAGRPIRDANPGTFYSGISNIDIEIRAGNPAAIGVRFWVAQHSYLAHMDFRIGAGRAGIENIGNEGDDLHFFGGDYGIITRKPSPGWPYLLIDSSFEGQRLASIKSQEAGLTLVRDVFEDVPTAVSTNPDHAEELWSKDCRFERIGGPVLIISDESSTRTEINVEDASCEQAPVFAQFRESGQQVTGAGPIYEVRRFMHGLRIAEYSSSAIDTVREFNPLASAPPPVPSDIANLPDQSTWVNVRSLGAKGDGLADDTGALRSAIASHRALYLPSGTYRVTDTLTLRPDTVLIGLSPIATVIALDDFSSAYQGPGTPKALLEAPQGGSNIVTGIGLDAGGRNPRAVAAKWMAGKDSLMNDVRFHGGHGTYSLDGSKRDLARTWERIYNNTHTADPDLRRRWDSEYPSLWITRGGGGTFKDIWTPSTFAQAGLYVSDTSTEGRIYAMSVEHHVRNEVKLKHVANWRIYDLQMEEERGESAACLPLEIDECSNIGFANTYSYRVVSSFEPFSCAVKIANSRDIRFRNFHCFSDSKVSFDTAICDQTHQTEIRQREFAIFDSTGEPPPQVQAQVHPSLAPGAAIVKLAGGFTNCAAPAVDAAGELYFIDLRWQRIWHWSPGTHGLCLVSDAPLSPEELGFDRAGDLLVVAREGAGTVYAFRPGASEDQIVFLHPMQASPHPGPTPLLPNNVWLNESGFLQETITTPRPFQYLSPDGTVFIPAGRDFVEGTLYYGSKMADLLRAFSLAPATPGQPFYICDESEQKTYACGVNADGMLSNPRLFAQQGGVGTVADTHGDVFIAADQIYVFDRNGQLIDTIDVPERPTAIIFGGKDQQTLFILGRTALYAVRAKYPRT